MSVRTSLIGVGQLDPVGTLANMGLFGHAVRSSQPTLQQSGCSQRRNMAWISLPESLSCHAGLKILRDTASCQTEEVHLDKSELEARCKSHSFIRTKILTPHAKDRSVPEAATLLSLSLPTNHRRGETNGSVSQICGTPVSSQSAWGCQTYGPFLGPGAALCLYKRIQKRTKKDPYF